MTHAVRITLSRSHQLFQVLLLDIWLQVSVLAQQTEIFSSDTLRSRCAGLIEQLRNKMRDADYDQEIIEEASYAQCGLLDDVTVRYLSDFQKSEWQSASLESHFFSSNNAGDNIFERINQLLLQTNPSLDRIALYDLVLRLGFRGRYASEEEPERQRFILLLGRYSHSTVQSADTTKAKIRNHFLSAAAFSLLCKTTLGIVFGVALWCTFSYQLTRSADRLQMLKPVDSIMSKED